MPFKKLSTYLVPPFRINTSTIFLSQSNCNDPFQLSSATFKKSTMNNRSNLKTTIPEKAEQLHFLITSLRFCKASTVSGYVCQNNTLGNKNLTYWSLSSSIRYPKKYCTSYRQDLLNFGHARKLLRCM